MNVLKRKLSIGLIAAAAAGITWVSASGVVVLYPATINGSLALPSETVTSIQAEFYPTAGGQAITKTTPATAPGPYPFELTVDGGNPDDPNDPGVSYRPGLYAYLQNPTGSQTYLRISRNNSITVNNTEAVPSATVPVSFSYPVSHRANATISVIGGTISSYYIDAYASNSISNESYRGRTSGNTSSQSSATNWVPMVPNGNVSVSGTVYVVNGQGVSSQRSLAAQSVNLSAGSASLSWTIDLTNTGSLEGDIALVAAPASTATPTSYNVIYRGASSSTSGISGSLSVSTSLPHYSLALTPGAYDVSLRTYFSNPSQNAETEPARVTITAGATTVKHFDNSFGVGKLDLSIGGFYALSNLQNVQSQLRSPTSRYAYNYQPSGTAFEYTLPTGTWQSYRTFFQVYDQSNPDLPINNNISRYHHNDVDAPVASVSAFGVTPLGAESFTLVKSNVYFDVEETEAQKALGVKVDLSSPYIYAYKYDYNTGPPQTLRRQSIVYSYGSSTAKPLSALTMVAEPGTYVLDARATVNGTVAQFSGSTITFGEPFTTLPGTGVAITPVDRPELKVSLNFSEVDTGGITTVVETPIGPAPPEGFKAACPDPDPLDPSGSVPCPTMYYDITSNAGWEDGTTQTEVCVLRQFPDFPNGIAELLTLWHYNESLPEKWEALPAPPNAPDFNGDGLPDPAIDCSFDPELCGCATAQECGISEDPMVNVFRVCGMTTSFSPFAIFQRKVRFDNEVDGVEYTGPTGPPSLQQFVVPADGTYEITAVGAEGANGTNSPSRKGGCGAEVSGDFALQAGDVVQILVGQKGTAAPYSAGGGGGTFVIKNGSPLLIAGGGGGVRAGALVDGRPGTVATSGTAGSTSSNYTTGFVAGGLNGLGGSRVLSYGAGGGGWLGNGAADGTYGDGGFAFLGANQAKGGAGKLCGAPAHGGYGGGAAGNGCYGGGGGGGYSGGGGGRIGGGGGSLNNGANPDGQDGKCTSKGHGSVIIDLVRP